MTPPETHRSQRGLALLLVLWVMTLLSMLVIGFADQTRLDRHRVANLVDAADAHAAVQAGLAIAANSLLQPKVQPQWRHDGTPRDVEFSNTQLTITLQDTNGCLNINTADASQLAALLKAVRVNTSTARSLAAAIIDWRDPDNLLTVNGAELATYVEAGSSGRPGNRPFLSVDELGGVLGMTGEILGHVSAYVTVHSAASTPNPMTAPKAVLQTFVPAEEIPAILSRRAAQAAANTATDSMASDLTTLNEESKGATAEDLAEVAEGPVYNVEIRATAADGVSATGRAVIWLTQNAKDPYRILDWRPGQPFEEAASAAQ
jgi:general secretion pathway protein K